MVDFTLTEEQKKWQMRAREFAQNELLPVAHYFDEVDEMPEFILERAYEAGLMNLGIPKKYGGPGLDNLTVALVIEEFAAADPGMATSIFDNGLGAEPVLLCDNEEVKERILKDIIENRKYICFATSEATMGSDVAAIRCKAIKDGENYILKGKKHWITNGGVADYISVFATANHKDRHKGIVALVVDMKTPGITVSEHIPKLGQRTSNTVVVEFEDVRVPAKNLLAPEGGPGFKLGMKVFSHTRPFIGAFAVGAARSAMEYAMQYAMKRKAFGQLIGMFEGIQFMIAEMYQKVETARLMVWRSAWETDNTEDGTLWASMAKFWTTEAAFDVANNALQIMAGYGYTKLFPVEKLLRDIRLLQIYEGTNQVQRLIVIKYLLKGGFEPIMPKYDEIPRLTAENPQEAAKNGMPDQEHWRCRICGYNLNCSPGEFKPPDHCNLCRYKGKAFKKLWPKE
jgi:acyl-CoA dehydrogenase